VGLLAGAGPATAGDPLVPGGSQTLTVRLPDSWDVQASVLDVSVARLTQFENDCLEPEAEAGDHSCDVQEGDLAQRLLATVVAGRVAGNGCRATGRAVPLRLVDRAVSSRLTVGGVQCLVVRLEFPEGAADNVAQSDSLAFDLRVVAEGLGDVATTPQVSGSGNSAGGRATAGGGPGNAGSRTPGAAAGAPGEGRAAAVPAVPGTTTTVVDEMTTAVNVGGPGASVQTAAAETRPGDAVVAWGSLLLGVVTLGGVAFAMLMRRRRWERAA
jgi:hypothetical protein